MSFSSQGLQLERLKIHQTLIENRKYYKRYKGSSRLSGSVAENRNTTYRPAWITSWTLHKKAIDQKRKKLENVVGENLPPILVHLLVLKVLHNFINLNKHLLFPSVIFCNNFLFIE